MTTPKQYSSDILKALNFPKAGDTLGETKVVSSKHNFLKGSIMRYQIVLPKGTREKDVPTLLKSFFNTQMLEGEHNMMVKHHDYTVKPHEGKVAVVGAMHIVPIALANPGAQEFDEDYSKMEMSNPETYFRKFDCKGFSGTQFRAKLFSLVSFMGENYGYSDGSHIYHRRASLVMPKIKITKAIKDANMMYHTHPKKDEPSLSSADDYLLYFDLSHEPRSIRDFYTVMKDRMDHFKITPKKGSKNNYLKLSEDKFIDEVNAKMDELEGKWSKKIPKEGASKQDDLAFCEGITRDLVAWLNKKYGKMFTIKYKCYYKVKQNPPKLETQDIHLNDEFLKKALVEVSSGDYTWPGFKAEIQPHESYAYWHQRYYTEHVRDSYMTLGVNLFGTDNRRRDEYLNMPLGESTVSRLEALNILNLSYDVAKADGKIRDGTGFMSRLDDLCEYLELSQDSCDNLKLLEDIIHSGDVFSESAKTLSGDYYPLVLLSFYSIQAIEIMKKVNAQEMNLEVAKFEVYNQLKAQVGGELTSFLREHIRLFENGFVAGGFHTASNPPVYFNKVEAYTNYPPEALEISDILADAFDEPGNSFNPERTDINKKMVGKKQWILYVPTEQGRVTVMLYRSTGKAQLKGPSMEACAEAAKKINQQLYKYGARGVKFDDKFDISEKTYAVNPSKAQVITVSGPSGSGKSSMIRTLLKMLPNSKTAPTITTRQERKSDKPGERTFVTVDAFKNMANRGALVGVQLQASGNYYARKKSDFEDADYVLVDVSLRGVNDITSAFPNTFSIFLEPVETPEVIRQRLLRRGDMSAKEAAGRAAIIPSMIESSKKMSFDARIQTQQGRFDYAAKQAFDLIPKQNPGEDSGKLTDLHMLTKYTVEELENDNDLPTVAECADAVTKANYIGGGAFGKVFRVPGTDYLFKVNQRHDPKLFKELTAYLDGKSKTFTYPTEGVTRYRVDYRIPFECGQPRAWLRREGGGSEPDTIMNNLEGFTIADKIPQGKYEKGDKRRFKAQQGLVPYYTADKIKEYYKWVEEVSKIPQESINQTVSEMQYLISRGIPQDIHSGNMIYNPKTKKVTITDWFWDEKAVGKSIITNSPSLTGIFERVCIINWIRAMTDYFSQHGKKPAQKEAVKVFKAGVGKAARQALEYFEKCLKAFEANKVSPSKSDYQESFFSSYKFETETYVDMIRRVLSGDFQDYYYDFDEVQRADAVAISNPTVPKKQLTLDAGETLEERAERDGRLAENKKEIEEEDKQRAKEIAEQEARLKQTELPRDNPMEVSKEQLQLDIGRPLDDSDERTLIVHGDVYNLDKGSIKGSNVTFGDELSGHANKVGGNQSNDGSTQSNPRRSKPTLEEFRKWVELVNMKNKELKAFYDSDWFAASGLTPKEAKAQGIKSGQDSFRAILRMRKKLGLTGPKDYIKAGPQITKRYYEMALDKWTGPDNKVSALDDRSDWGWMKRQIRFNSRASAFPYNKAQEKRKGPLVKKQKTQNQPSRKLLSLWVWGHDPWRWARKNGVANMPKCPDVPWVGMTEKRKYGKIPVIMAPRMTGAAYRAGVKKMLKHRYNPRIPKKYEGQDPSEHSDLYTDEDPKGTIQGLGFKDKATAEKSVNIIKRSGKTHAHKIQAAMAMEQRARFHPNATPGIEAAQKVYAKFIEEMKAKTKRNPKKTPEGRKIPTRYLKGLNKEEMAIAAKEIDKGYKYDIKDPKAYEYWKSDIQATARGYKTVPSKYKKKFIRMYGPLPEKGKFLDKIAKATKIKKSILQKVYDKGLAAWRGGHRPGVQQHQWAAGRVYSFVTLGNTVKKGNKKMPDYSLAVKAGLVKDNPKEADAYVLVNGSRQGAINWVRENKWEYSFEDEAIDLVEDDERIPARLVQWFVREASNGNIDLYEDTEEALSNWSFLKDNMGDQTVVNHIKKEYEIKTPKNILLYSSGDLNGIANWYHSLFEAPPLPDDYQDLLKYTEGGAELVAQTKEWVVIELTEVDATVAFTSLRNNSWCVNDPGYAEDYLDDGPLHLVLKPSGAFYALFHYASDEFHNIDNEPFPIPDSLDDLMEEVTGVSIAGAIYTDPEAAFRYALELVELYQNHPVRFKEGEEAILTSPEYSCKYAWEVLMRRWPKAEELIAADGEWAGKYARHVVGKRWTEFADTVTAQIAEAAISIVPEAVFSYAQLLGGRWKEAEANILTDPLSAFRYAHVIVRGPWPEAEESIASDGRAAYKYAAYVLESRFERGEKNMFDFYTFHSRHPVLTPTESIQYARVAGERIPALEKAIIKEAWGNYAVMANRYEYTNHAAIAVDYAIAVDVGPIPELEEIIAKESFESFMYASHLDRPFPEGEEAILEPLIVFAFKRLPGARAADYEDKFYNGNWPRLRRKLEEYKKTYKDKLAGEGLDSLFADKIEEKKFIDSYYSVKAKGTQETRDNPGEWRHGEFSEDDPFEEYF